MTTPSVSLMGKTAYPALKGHMILPPNGTGNAARRGPLSLIPPIMSLIRQLMNLAQSSSGQKCVRLFQSLLLAGIVVFLFVQVRAVGWSTLVQNLPTQPVFFVFFAIRFLALPITEFVIYRSLWAGPLVALQKRGLRHLLPVFLRKRAYNFSVFSYSGEAFLTLYARRALGLSLGTAASTVKDVNILSSFTANVMAVVMIGAAWVLVPVSVFGPAHGLETVSIPIGVVMAGGFAMALIAVFVVGIVGHRLIAVGHAAIRRVLAWHSLRQIVQLLSLFGMYGAVMAGPSDLLVPWGQLLSLVILLAGIQLAVSRIPFLPNQDLAFVGVALAIIQANPFFSDGQAGTSIPVASMIAGVVVAEAGLSQLVCIGLFLATLPLETLPRAGSKSALCVEVKNP
ncbi:MAG: hypothetical protein AAGH42_09450 [Pseudomonadota bacterium]